MRLLHGLARRRLALLASAVLQGWEREWTLGHLEGCPRCREELASIQAVLELVAADPIRHAEPALPTGALVARVEACLNESRRALPSEGLRWRLTPLVAAAAVALALATLPRGGALPTRREPSPALEIRVSDEVLRRLERSVARKQAVRYLSEAQDVLVNVSSSPRNCARGSGRVDVATEARRSRELLARRALVETDHVQSVRPVLDDVEQMLRDVASLESCARPGELDAIHREISRRHLLMKIDLMTLELQG